MNTAWIAPTSRIIARYLSGALVALGAVAPALGASLASDADVITAIGIGLGVVAEAFYALARRKGWAK